MAHWLISLQMLLFYIESLQHMLRATSAVDPVGAATYGYSALKP
jgi:hypothetical protein